MDNRLILFWNKPKLRDSLLHTTTFRIEWSTQSWDQKLPVGYWRIYSFPFLILVWQWNTRRVVLNIPRRDSWCYPKLYPGDVKNYTPRSRKVTRQLKYVVRKLTSWKEKLYVNCISFLFFAAEELLWSQSRGVGGSLQRGWLERWPTSKHFCYLLSLLFSQRLHMPYHIVMDYSLTVLFFLLFVAFPRWHLPAGGEETQKLVL